MEKEKYKRNKLGKEAKRATLSLLLVVFLLLFSACADKKSETGAETSSPGGSATNTTEGAIVTESAITTESAIKAEPESVTENAVEKAAGIEEQKEKKQSCTFSIDCLTILDNAESLDSSKSSLVPESGFIFGPQNIEFEEGESVFDLLLRITKENKIHMEFTKTPALNTNYVEGIGNLYEFDCGELSGWTYLVNGEVLGMGSSNALVKKGDVIEWKYTCDQGQDVGGPEL